jgi:hypothetical protein
MSENRFALGLLRICRTCGHVGCCDDSPNRHATKHFRATTPPIIEGYDPPEQRGSCYVDEVAFDLSDRPTPQPASMFTLGSALKVGRAGRSCFGQYAVERRNNLRSFPNRGGDTLD